MNPIIENNSHSQPCSGKFVRPVLALKDLGWRRYISFLYRPRRFERVISVTNSMIVVESKGTIDINQQYLASIGNSYQKLTCFNVVVCRRIETQYGFRHHLKINLDGHCHQAQQCSSELLNQLGSLIIT